MKQKTTYKKVVAKIVFTTLTITLIVAFLYGDYLKKKAISDLAHIDAKKTSMLVFESLYSVMKRGWDKEDLKEIITRLNSVDPKMQVDVFRSENVSKLYGEIEKDKKLRETNESIQKAMGGSEVLNIDHSDFIDYYYPVSAKNECLLCHTNVEVGDILGVISVSFPIEDLKVSLTTMINFFVLFIVVFSLIIFFAIFFKINRYLVRPIEKFAGVITNITQSKDVTQRVVDTSDQIEEMDSIKNAFNSMLDVVEHQFYYDQLTGLLNRRKLTERLEKKDNISLMIINIDSFQEINDLYGDEVGDFILKDFARFLQKITPATGILYRLHADEFAYICTKGGNFENLETFVSFVSENIARKTFKISDQSDINLTVTIGVSYGDDTLLTNADIALKLAKKTKKNYLFYDTYMATTKEYEKNLSWSKKLKQAIEQDKIIPVFQPIVDTQTKKILKYEALIRMIDENGDLISPIHFLELAKKNKLYHKLTKIMVDKTFEIFKELPYSVSINLSVEDILNKDIVAFIIDKLQISGIGKRVVFEIIESEGIENFKEVLEFIQKIKLYGAKISIDDFGTGYSNFEYLMKLKVDYIKIDGSMIKNIDFDENSQIVTKTIIDFAKKMNIKTVAEFVYSQDIYEKVLELGVDYSQGYYFGEPKKLDSIAH